MDELVITTALGYTECAVSTLSPLVASALCVVNGMLFVELARFETRHYRIVPANNADDNDGLRVLFAARDQPSLRVDRDAVAHMRATGRWAGLCVLNKAKL